jgi:hypothetical protein
MTSVDAAANLWRRPAEGPWVALRILPWMIMLVAGAGAFYLGAAEFRREYVEQRLLAAFDAPGTAVSSALLTAPIPAQASAAYYETLAEFALAQNTPDIARARAAAAQAIEVDPQRPFVWAIMAYAEQEQAGRTTQGVVESLTRSMDLCPLCDEELVRWRFNFVLANWAAMPEPLRRKAFEHADILRWNGQNAEFLAEMRIKAEAAGIPYAAYRAAVVSPVPSLDHGRPPAG